MVLQRQLSSPLITAIRWLATVFTASSMWFIVPASMLGLGSLIQHQTGSLMFAALTMYSGTVLLAVLIVFLLSRLDRAFRASPDVSQKRRSPLEPVLVVGCALALAAVVFWMAAAGGCASAPQVCPL